MGEEMRQAEMLQTLTGGPGQAPTPVASYPTQPADIAPLPASPKQNLRILKRFKGHSGATILLMKGTGAPFVRKISSGPHQNNRLIAQCHKQAKWPTSLIGTPKIIATGTLSGSFFFDMEFAPATSLAHACVAGIPFDTVELASRLKSLVEHEKSLSTGPIDTSVFEEKIYDVFENISLPDLTAQDVHHLQQLRDQMLGHNWSGCMSSFSHGDLTLENIIISQSGSFSVIDMDDPAISSYTLDIAKLYQDLLGFWCLREVFLPDSSYVSPTSAILQLKRLRRIADQIVMTVSPETWSRIPCLTAFHLCRTLPYSKDRVLFQFVCRRIEYLLRI